MNYFILVFTIILTTGFVLNLFTGRSISNELLTKREPNLDGLRYILASLVAFHHYFYSINFFNTGSWSSTSDFISYIGPFGVAIFFIISGYLFANIPFNENNWKNFFINRFFRIGPISLISSSTCILISISLFGLNDISKIFYWFDFGLLNIRPNFNTYNYSSLINAGVTWTLVWEWMFYITLPILSMFLARNKVISTIPFIIFLLLVLTITKPSIFQILLFGFYFLTGIISKIYLKNINIKISKNQLDIISILLFLTCILIGSNTKSIDYIKYILPFLYAILFFTIIKGANWFGILTTKGFTKLGDASYSIYLLHGIFWFLLNYISYNYFIGFNSVIYYILFIATWTLVCITSLYLYTNVELKCIKYGKRITQPKERDMKKKTILE
jgi:peptidoglycan/LPS O-acetylase OafA/YrhL